MSVIIRLQNLPWSANAMDIRTFFRGLSIPEGGVHIVGGEQGDAFIAFSTDEDARQAMMNDCGKIKEVQVKLLLSSRSEMHKVIESARQNVSFLQLSQPIVPPPVQQPSALPPSISGLLAQNIKALPLNLPSFPVQQVDTVSIPTETVQIDSDKDKDVKRSYKNNDRRSLRSRSKSRDRDRDRKDRSDRSRDRDRKDKRDRSRSRDRSRDRDRRRRDRSRSRDRRDRKRDRKDRSRDRDRGKEVSDPRLQRKEDKKNDNINDDNKMYSQQNYNKSKDSLLGEFPRGGDRSDQSKTLPPVMGMGGPRLPYVNQGLNHRIWAPDIPMMNNQGQSMNNRMNAFDNGMFPNRFNMNMNPMQRLQEIDEKRNPDAFQKPDMMNFGLRNMGPRLNFNDGNFGGNVRMPPPNFMDKGANNHESRSRFNHNPQSKGFCVKITNLLTSAGYGDIRRFFSGNFISSQGLKIINNDNGKRSGTAYIKFYKIESKQNALSKNGELLKGRPVVITHLDDEDFESAVDSYRPNKDSEDSGDEGDSQRSLVIVEKNENDDRDEIFKVLLLEDLPAFAKEHDIMKMFSDYSLLSIFIVVTKDVRKQYIAYVQFVNADDAKAALNNKSKHLIGHKVIKVSPCSETAFETAKANQNNIDDNSERSKIDTQNQNSEDFNNDNDMSSIPRDPRQRRFDIKQEDSGSYKQMKPFHNPPIQGNNLRFQWRGNSNAYPNHGLDRDHHSMMRRPPLSQNDFNKSFMDSPRLDCIFLKGLPLRTNDRDILDFFSDVGVIPTKTHLMLTLQGQPSGDCFCEFLSPEEATNAVAKNGAVLGGNTISVELVTKIVVDEALGIIPPEKSFNMRGGFRGGRGFIPRGHPRRMRGGPAPYHTGSRGGGNRFMGPNEHGYNSSDNNDAGTEGFGAVGCVLSLENVPFRATIDEILNFFRDFELSPNNVIRRFTDNGNPTGDVRVNLLNQMEAQRAVQQLNKQYIRDRSITISLL